ncbi:E3 ubiquitin-protein ligase TRIP12-like [Coccinella septempunctata]|uniref:E3 ubiquitin-protein ligase TRIP12-like n=1 Tax=Coccinella septempunctata TaxID=41139 RepID=UPI001D06C58B|nr:E3 ubiquitin-protein ligase TRIP12-like [Coccinella septempunctata]
MVQKFLTKFFKDLPRTNRPEDVTFRDDIITYVRDIYGRLINEPELVNAITSSDYLREIYDMMDKEVFGLLDSHKIMEALSIIAVHSDSNSQDLIEMGIAKTLFALYEKFHTNTETHKLDIVTLAWSLMPNLPERYKINNLMREAAIRNLKTTQWQREVERNVWIPFAPRVNDEIEICRRRTKKDKLLIIESGSICEVFIDKMQHLDHSNGRVTSIKWKKRKVYEVLKLKKTKKSTKYRLKTNFVHFAFLLVGKRFYGCHYDVDRYQCLEVLLSLVMNMTREQHDRIVPSTKNCGVVETVRNLEWVIHTWKDSDIGLLALEVIAELLTNFPDIYEEPCRKEGVQSIVESTFKEKVEAIDLVRYIQQSEALQAIDLVRYIQQSEAATSVFVTLPRRPVGLCEALEDIKIIFENTELSLYEIRASGAVSKLHRILTEMSYHEDFYDKLRTFLNVFANLPKEKNATVVEIVSNTFERAVGILNDIIKQCSQFKGTLTTNYPIKYIYAAGVRTIGKLSRKTLRITIRSSENESIVFNNSVFPFTTIQYLESYLLHVMSGYRDYKQWNESIEGKIELYLNECPLPPHLTVLEAVRLYQSFPLSNIFEHDHVFTYKVRNVGLSCPNTMEHLEPKRYPLESHFRRMINLGDEEYYDQALHLLQIFYGLNRYWASLYSSLEHKFIIDMNVFVNPTIDNAMYNTLIDPFNAVVQNYPEWMNVVARCPFLLSLNTRKLAFRVLSLDRHRALRSVMEYYKAYSAALLFDNRYPLIQVDRTRVLDQFHEVRPILGFRIENC